MIESAKTIPLQLDVVNSLYLELSEVATATTARELKLKLALENANSLCASMYAISSRDGAETNWKLFRKNLKAGLSLQHRAMYPERYDANGKALR